MSALWPKAVLFDLDGTLIDSAPDIHAATNTLLAREGLGPLSLDVVKSMIGEGTRRLVERAFAACGRTLDPAELSARYEAMVPLYAANLTGLTTLMPGVAEAMQALQGEGTAMALVTNKPDFAIAEILQHFGLARHFPVIVGGDAGVPHKPAPDMLFLALERLGGVSAADAVFVGDSPADARSAQAAGMKLVLIEGGYSREPLASLGADAVLPDMRDLRGAIERLQPGADR
ncbi:phosphoglycolate phosphatase [Tianweitania sediminis]|uniref:phosphoglycolate phosphatase n=1 Tax=Tianweitania sediminis TaxID=1502156 RepID=A0A8J7R0M0_9HYPH|nr:phosphoglycolate phosphatase [Tianweitania sediminis]MBP0437890.1 phosphoglycolate phosphatase [Tianweitania sediminis]